MVIMALAKNMIKSILKYLRWSNISLQIDLNPFSWRFHYSCLHNPEGYDPKQYFFSIRLLMFKLYIIIDDGSW